MHKSLFILLVLFSNSIYSATTEVLSEDGVKVVYEQTGDNEQINQFKKNILPTIKEMVNGISTDLGTRDKNVNAELHFYSPETYYAKFPDAAEKQIPAKYSGRIIYVRADNEIDTSLKRSIRHELTHLLLDLAFKRIPGWVNEGLAVYEERKITIDPIPNNHDYNTIFMGKQNGSYRPISSLEGYDIFGRGHGTVAAGYAYTFAYVGIWELIQKNGLDSIRQFIKASSQGKSVKDAFESAFASPTYGKFEDYIFELSQKKS